MATETKKIRTSVPTQVMPPTYPIRLPGLGVDIGTANIAACRYITEESTDGEGVSRLTTLADNHTMRDCFITLPIEEQMVLDGSGVNYHVSDDETQLLIIGNEAMTYAGAMGAAIRRPLAKGFISDKEDLSKEVVRRILGELLGAPLVPNEMAVYSVPGMPVEGDGHSANYHTRFFGDRLRELGYTPLPVNEAMAVFLYEQRAENPAKIITGLCFSFGAGMINVALVFRGILVRSFSLPMGGDYIDEAVSRATNTPLAQVTVLKEEGISLAEGTIKDRKGYHDVQSDRQAEAVALMYRELLTKLRDVLTSFLQDPANRVDIKDVIPVIVSGGTTMAEGFLELFDEIVLQDLDVRIALSKNAVHSQNPMMSVAWGSLRYAHMRQKKVVGSN